LRTFLQDTIAAISTPTGEGGIGIVRISGPNALEISSEILRFKNKTSISETLSHTIALASVVDNEDLLEIDEVLVSIMRAPNTYTREDVVEINCHGNNVALRNTLRLILKAGARIAEPGEFTKRAFMNGRIDLAQAEAVIDIIKSRTEAGLKAAINQLEGNLSLEIKRLSEEIVEVLVQIEATIDFSDEDIQILPREKLINILIAATNRVGELIRTSIKGRIVKDGLRTAIIGRPNVGKSSVLNALLRMEKAIVTDIPGTTRDIVEETININGIPLILKDTAGLRDTSDKIEKIGVELAHRAIDTADIILCVIDGSEELKHEDFKIIDKCKDNNAILVINKSDISHGKAAYKMKLPEEFYGFVEVSAKTGQGIRELEQMIEKMIIRDELNSGEVMITNIRHEQLLEFTHDHLNEARNLIERMQPEEVIAIVLREALDALGEITGETISENILEQIFSRFCIGK
jgi:tRNA modification GTPase